MTTSSALEQASRGSARQASGVARFLALAASPTLALMALIGANDTHPASLCAASSAILPIDGMTAMYLLMGVFHLSPWLKLASNRL